MCMEYSLIGTVDNEVTLFPKWMIILSLLQTMDGKFRENSEQATPPSLFPIGMHFTYLKNTKENLNNCTLVIILTGYWTQNANHKLSRLKIVPSFVVS